MKVERTNTSRQPLLSLHIYVFRPRNSVCSQRVEGSSLKLDVNVSTFAKEALCVPEASDTASRGLQKYDELITQRSWENRGKQTALELKKKN